MTPEDYARLRADYFEAVEMSEEHRAGFLVRVCQEDPKRGQALKDLFEKGKSTIDLDQRIFEIHIPFSGTPPLNPGELLQKRFRIARLVGSGGMGDVYKAIDLINNSTVALKTLTGEFANDPRALGLLRTEVQFALKVSGPDVCRIHAFYPLDGSLPAIPFFTMEFLDGITLADKLRISGPIFWADVKRIARDICTGLAIIHQEKIVHRDLKPRNIMLVQRSDREHAVVTDFGIAHWAEIKGHTEAMAGTVEYMAPEQFEGKDISAATDIFGLGVVLYELLSGVLPFPSNNPIAAVIQRAAPPRPVSSFVKGIPPHWDRVIAKCLAFDAERRYQTAADVFRALSTGPLYPENLRRDHPWLFAAACAIPAAALVLGGYQLYGYIIEPRQPPEAQKWYLAGVSALHEGTYVRAMRSLQKALEIDPNYPMTHARLAEAWADLDFQSDAQRELLIAMPQEWRLPELDKMYLDAIRATISEDHGEGVAVYTRLLRKLPPGDQSAGNVDLGMVYERSGDISRALSLYAKAAALDRSSPAPYMHMAVLQSRLLNVKDADQAFGIAGKLFAAELNQEGLAELHYEQGYALNGLGKARPAKTLLKQALDSAITMDCVQLQLRALTQIISADYLISTDDLSPEYLEANQMTERVARIARDNRLDSWLADGLVRRANVQLIKGQVDQAESTVQEAILLAKQNRQFRVQAMADFTLASVMNQKGIPAQAIGPAQSARGFFDKHGYLALAAFSSLLITRAQRDQSQYDQAIKSGYETLDFANRSGIRRMIMQSEETVGSVFTAVERYPEALPHYERAISFTEREDDKGRQILHYANALWQTGRYQESDAALNSLPHSANIQLAGMMERTSSLLSRRKYKEAKLMAESALANNQNMDPDDRKQLEWDKLVARAHLSTDRAALQQMRNSVSDPGDDNPSAIWDRRLQLAEADFAAGLIQETKEEASAAAEFFSSVARYASQLRGECLAASASRKLKDDAEFKSMSNKVVDISSKLQQNWGPDAFHTYVTRPDVQAIVAGIDLSLRIPGGKP